MKNKYLFFFTTCLLLLLFTSGIYAVENAGDTCNLYDQVEVKPVFETKNYKEFREYIAKNTLYPPIAIEKKVQGTVYVSFVINEKGKPVNVKVLRPVDKHLDAEAIRVVSSSPRWTPGRHKGVPVKVLMNTRITFQSFETVQNLVKERQKKHHAGDSSSTQGKQ
ncbi:MAG: energy transducer TonB [Bacteroidales bacterium]|jgi:protein TonB|nr:energy transducer TonB [Bacteroidales bacterium]